MLMDLVSVNKTLARAMMLELMIAWFILFDGITITFSTKPEGISPQRHARRLDDASYKARFISNDCGVDEGYTEESSTLYYEPDEKYVHTGKNANVSPEYKSHELLQLMYNVRSFPEGIKNCYTLKPAQGKDTKYMVRAYFMYGNYDSQEKAPTFDLYLGVDVWDTVRLDNSSQVVVKEMIHTPSTDYLYVCVVNKGSGTPFISGLELRHLNDTALYDYKSESGSIFTLGVIFPHCNKLSGRYPVDTLDRIWIPMDVINGRSINTTSVVNSTTDEYKLPSSVMQVALEPFYVSVGILLQYTNSDPSTGFYLCLHMAELQSLGGDEIREFTVTVNDQSLLGPFVPPYLAASTKCSDVLNMGPQLTISFQSTKRATLPPILNALEIFTVKNLSQLSTNQTEVDALVNIKSMYNLTKNWQGDPCNPSAYSWVGIDCSYEGSNFSRITSLNLSSSGLVGDITPSIANLCALQVLDLSNNKLKGQIPEFLAELTLLTTLKLTGNSFTGSVPELLLERSRKGLLSLSMENSTGLCSSTSCNKKKKARIAPIAALASAAVLVLLLAVVCISFLVYARRKKQKTAQPGYSKRKGGLSQFTYSEVTDMTRGFQRELGKGGFGIVYYGCLKGGAEVAVKMLSPSIHASEQFSAEVELLMAIRHKNLVSLIGYCEEGSNLGLIYEYMACGDLRKYLLGADAASESPTWKKRLQIATDAAQGLDYLHSGCRPPIVHRDVKTPNILLNNSLQAKMADFGLSKIFPDEFKSYVSTRVIGTPGYLDPEYHVTQQLNEKSDVYSFGVVLLELITGREPIVKIGERKLIGLVHWVSPMIERGDSWSIVDQRLKPIVNTNSIWRATDIALMCVKPTERPTMSQIVSELKECLAIEMNAGNSSMNPDDSREMSPMIPSTGMAPAAR